MKKEVSNKNNVNFENVFIDNYKDRYEKLKGGKNNFYNIVIYLISLCVFVFIYLYLKNTSGVITLKDFSNIFDFRVIMLCVLFYFTMILLKSFIMFLNLSSKTKMKKFGVCYKSVSKSRFWSDMSVYGVDGDVTYLGSLLENKKINSDTSLDLLFKNKVSRNIAFLIYGWILFLTGIFVYPNIVNPFIIIISVFYLFFNFIYFLFIIMSVKNQRGMITFVAGFVKKIYDLKLIKNYEKVYNNMIAKTMIYSRVFKGDKIIFFTSVVVDILCVMLKGLCVFSLIHMCGVVSNDDVWKILYLVLLFDCFVSIIPIPNTTLFFEIIFIFVFGVLHFNSTIFWILLCFRLLILLVPLINVSIIKMFELLKEEYSKKIKFNL